MDQRAIGVITGEVGAGETVAVRAATAALDPSRHVVITWPTQPSGCAACCPTSWPPGHTPPTTNPPWHRRPLRPCQRTRRTGRNPVLVVDEAHLLDNHQLEAIRLLTNHEMDSGSLFAVIMVGQPSLRQHLRLGVLAALDQRIAVRYSIAGMSGADTAD
ncbi:AAA domain protein [Mycobacterium xenopi 3993]|nr:AAA domain protein [Mycobacterium xenopi 3993]